MKKVLNEREHEVKLLLITFAFLTGIVAEIAFAKVDVISVSADASGRLLGMGSERLGALKPSSPPPRGSYEFVIFELTPVSGAMKELVRLQDDYYYYNFTIDPMGTKGILIRTSRDNSKKELMVMDLKTGTFTLTPLQ